MDTPVVKLPRGFSEGIEGGGWPQEDAFQPYGKGFDWLRRGTGCRERSSRHLEFQLSREQVLVNLP